MRPDTHIMVAMASEFDAIRSKGRNGQMNSSLRVVCGQRQSFYPFLHRPHQQDPFAMQSGGNTAAWALEADHRWNLGVELQRYRHGGDGTTVIIATLPTLSLVTAVSIVVPTAPWSDHGIPHCLEHLCFLGTAAHPRGLLDRAAMSCISSGTNAWTAEDHTCFTFDCCSEDGAERLLPLFLEHVMKPALNTAAFLTEIHHLDAGGHHQGVVYNEMLGRENTEADVRDALLRASLFPGTSMAFEAGGRSRAIARVTLSQIAAFHRLHYRTDNVTVVVVRGSGESVAAGAATRDRLLLRISEAMHNLRPGPVVASGLPPRHVSAQPKGRSPGTRTPTANRIRWSPTLNRTVWFDAAGLGVAPSTFEPQHAAHECPLVAFRVDRTFAVGADDEDDGDEDVDVGTVTVAFRLPADDPVVAIFPAKLIPPEGAEKGGFGLSFRDLLPVVMRLLSSSGASPLQRALTECNPPLCTDVSFQAYEFAGRQDAVALVCTGVEGLHVPSTDPSGEASADTDSGEMVLEELWRAIASVVTAFRDCKGGDVDAEYPCPHSRLTAPHEAWIYVAREIEGQMENFEDDAVDYVQSSLIRPELWQARGDASLQWRTSRLHTVWKLVVSGSLDEAAIEHIKLLMRDAIAECLGIVVALMSGSRQPCPGVHPVVLVMRPSAALQKSHALSHTRLHRQRRAGHGEHVLRRHGRVSEWAQQQQAPHGGVMPREWQDIGRLPAWAVQPVASPDATGGQHLSSHPTTQVAANTWFTTSPLCVAGLVRVSVTFHAARDHSVPAVLLAALPFECDLMDGTSFAQLNESCEREFIYYGASSGIEGSEYCPAFLPDAVDASFVCVAEKIDACVDLFVRVLKETVATPARLSILTSRLNTDLKTSLRDGATVLSGIMACLSHDDTSPWHRQSALRLARIVPRLADTFVDGDCAGGAANAAAASITAAWRKTVSSYAAIHVTSVDVAIGRRAAEKIAASFAGTAFPAGFSLYCDAAPRRTTASKLYVVVNPASADSGIAEVRYGPLPVRGRVPRAYALYVLCEALSAVEGPLYSAVRCRGLAYGASLSFDHLDGWLDVTVHDTNAPVDALAACFAAIVSFLTKISSDTHRNECAHSILQAKASCVHSAVTRFSSPASLRSAVFRELTFACTSDGVTPQLVQTALLSIQSVTLDDCAAVAATLLKLLRGVIPTAAAIVVADTHQATQLAAKWGKRGSMCLPPLNALSPSCIQLNDVLEALDRAL